MSCSTCTAKFSVDTLTIDTSAVRCPSCGELCQLVDSDNIPSARPARRFYRSRSIRPVLRWPRRS